MKFTKTKIVLGTLIAIGAIAFTILLMYKRSQNELTRAEVKRPNYGLDVDWGIVESLTTSTTQDEFIKLSNQILKRSEPYTDWFQWRQAHKEIVRAFAQRAAELKLVVPKRLWSTTVMGSYKYSAGYIELPYGSQDQNDPILYQHTNYFWILYTGGLDAYFYDEMPGEIVATTTDGFLIHNSNMYGEDYYQLPVIPEGHNPRLGELSLLIDELMNDGDAGITVRSQTMGLCFYLKPMAGRQDIYTYASNDPSTTLKSGKTRVSVYKMSNPEENECPAGYSQWNSPSLLEFETTSTFSYEPAIEDRQGVLDPAFPIKLLEPEQLIHNPNLLKFSAYGKTYTFDGSRLVKLMR